MIDNLSHADCADFHRSTHFVCACHPDGNASVACASAYFSLIYVMLYRGSAKVCRVVCVKKIQLRMVLCIPCVLCETISHPAWQYVLMFFCQKIIFTQNTRNTQNFASHGLQSVRYIKLLSIRQKHHPAVI